jgi:hypothetical protein
LIHTITFATITAVIAILPIAPFNVAVALYIQSLSPVSAAAVIFFITYIAVALAFFLAVLDTFFLAVFIPVTGIFAAVFAAVFAIIVIPALVLAIFAFLTVVVTAVIVAVLIIPVEARVRVIISADSGAVLVTFLLAPIRAFILAGVVGDALTVLTKTAALVFGHGPIIAVAVILKKGSAVAVICFGVGCE